MINRVLIRIKVVQMLYSYLLIENHFMLESQPSAPTKEKRFAYSLYLDTLYLMIRIAGGIEKRGGEKPLADTRFIRRISADDKLRTLVRRYASEPFPLDAVATAIADDVKTSAIYKNYLKSIVSDQPDESVWNTIFDKIICVSPEYNAAVGRRENFTLRGVERMKEMMAETFRSFYASQDNIGDALRSLDISLEKARELYFRLLMLPSELTLLRERQLDDNRHKYILTDEDINPNLRFVENQLVSRINADTEIQAYCERNKISWLSDDRQTLESLLKAIMASDIYREYMEFPATDLHMDCEFWKDTFRHVILQSPDFLEMLEDKSVFWNDDLDVMATFAVKTFRRFENAGPGEQVVLPKFKDEEDARFGAELFTLVIKNKDSYRAMIDSALDKTSWDTERLAFMDVVIMMTAMAELMNFPKIPLNVTLNEYIELAKSYSTGKSGVFVHGLLGSIVSILRQDGRLTK